ncbi:hypothetical protein CER19_23725 [Pseudomonas sp. GL93]|nr:hypothetical protein CER19_23725 [Pseudomonas sp. GL93]
MAVFFRKPEEICSCFYITSDFNRVPLLHPSLGRRRSGAQSMMKIRTLSDPTNDPTTGADLGRGLQPKPEP